MEPGAALARLRAGDPAGALGLLEADGGDAGPAIHALRGMCLLAIGDPQGAILSFRAAIAGGDRSDITLLNLAVALDRSGAAAAARTLMQCVADNAPAWDEPHLRLAESWRRDHATAAALHAYQEALDRDPNRVESLIGCGSLLIGQRDGAQAQLLLLRACGRAPQRAEAWDALGLALLLTGDTGAAESALAEARRLAPERFEFALHTAEAAVANGSVAAELARAELAAETEPQNAPTHMLRGLLLEHAGRRPDAIDALEVAAALAPAAAMPTSLLGGMLARAMRLKDAEHALRRAREIDPDNARVCSDLAAVLMRMHQPAQTCELIEDLLRRIPPQAPILCNLANATAACGRQQDAVNRARAAIALDPESPLAWRTLCGTLPYTDGIDGATMLQAMQDCAARLPAAATWPERHHPGPARRLRIGLLSGSFRTHPVGWLTIAGLEALDPEAFELICFAQNAGTDPIGRRFRAIAREWFDIDTLNDAAAADLIRHARIDILIDLGGYGDNGRMAVCALRAAPVQVKWVGMQCHSTGLPAMDWFLSDRWETPQALDRFYSERILRMPDGYVCYSPPPNAPDVTPLPALANGFVTFGCFNNLAKLTPRVLATWATILHRIPDARLVLKAPQFAHAPTADRVRADIVQHGIDPSRLALRGPSPHRAFLAEYNTIDIVLDPFPYAGGLTTCEALWMGVPTITLPGETFASRHSLSHLSNVGLADWAATDLAAYMAQAVRRAADLPALADLRQGLRARVKASPLCDAPRFGKNLGAALADIWASNGGTHRLRPEAGPGGG